MDELFYSRRGGDCICASALRQRVTIETCSIARDRIGGLVETWSTLATGVPAEVRQASGREIWRRQQMGAIAGWTVTMRYRADVTTKARIVYGARVFDVRNAIDPDQRKRWLVLACEELIAP